MKKTLHAVLVAAALAAPVAFAQSPSGAATAAPAAPTAAAESAEGEVRRVDASNRKITLRHGEIRNLQMPPMTMVFEVKDATLLDKVKQGDKVRFTAEQVGGVYTVTTLEPMR